MGQKESVENNHGNGLAKDNTYCYNLERKERECFDCMRKQTNYIQFIMNLYPSHLHTEHIYTYPALASVFNMGKFYQRNVQ